MDFHCSKEKQNIRKLCHEKRQELNNYVIQKASLAIVENLLELIQSTTLKVLAYYPILSKKEVDIIPVLENLLQKNIQLYLPRIKEATMEVAEVRDLNKLETNKWDIWEPSVDIPISNVQDFDVILVPGLAFDRQGNRLGYGKGFYDMFLPKTTGIKVGVCFDELIVNSLPIEKHDVPMDIVITESGFYR